MLILHFIGLAMGLGTSFAHAFLGTEAAKMSEEEATKFRLQSLVLGRMGHIGLGLLIVSGLYLITPYWKILPSSPLMMLKLALVVILILLVAFLGMASKKAKKGDAAAQFIKMEKIGKLTFLIAIAIVVIAVYIFH